MQPIISPINQSANPVRSHIGAKSGHPPRPMGTDDQQGIRFLLLFKYKTISVEGSIKALASQYNLGTPFCSKMIKAADGRRVCFKRQPFDNIMLIDLLNQTRT